MNIKTIQFIFQLFVFLSVGMTAFAQGTLWYNGDPGQAGFANLGSYSSANNPTFTGVVYDNFIVSAASGGWQVDSVFGNFYTGGGTDIAGLTNAEWSIRSNVSTGNGGTLVAGGTSAVSLASNGSGNSLNPGYKISIAGLDLVLSPGTYWLAVVPLTSSTTDNFGSYAGLAATTGVNAIGLPAGNDGNAFYNSSSGINYQSSSQSPGAINDFSLGITGNFIGVPEPSTWAMLTMNAVAMLILRRRVR